MGTESRTLSSQTIKIAWFQFFKTRARSAPSHSLRLLERLTSLEPSIHGEWRLATSTAMVNPTSSFRMGRAAQSLFLGIRTAAARSPEVRSLPKWTSLPAEAAMASQSEISTGTANPILLLQIGLPVSFPYSATRAPRETSRSLRMSISQQEVLRTAWRSAISTATTNRISWWQTSALQRSLYFATRARAGRSPTHHSPRGLTLLPAARRSVSLRVILMATANLTSLPRTSATAQYQCSGISAQAAASRPDRLRRESIFR